MLKKVMILLSVILISGFLYLLLFSSGQINNKSTQNLFDREWLWNEYQSTSGVGDIEVPNPQNYTILLNKNGTYELLADCNRGSGNYTINDNHIEFGPTATTLIYCGEKSLDNQFTTLLSHVDTFVVERDELDFNLKENNGIMKLEAKIQ